jgi:hypothetical protein
MGVKMEKIIHDASTNEVTVVPMTKAEIDDHKLHKAETEAIDAQQQAKQAEKVALLERLGITEDEAKLLLG